MSERGEVPAGPNRSPAGNVRQDAAIQAFDQELDSLWARPGEALGKGVRPQEHRRPNDLVRIRLTHSARMAPEQPELKLACQLLRDGARDEAAEAGVDPVGVLVRPVSSALDQLAGAHDPLSRPTAECRRRSVDRDCPNVVDRQVVACQLDGRAEGHLRPV